MQGMCSGTCDSSIMSSQPQVGVGWSSYSPSSILQGLEAAEKIRKVRPPLRLLHSQTTVACSAQGPNWYTIYNTTLWYRAITWWQVSYWPTVHVTRKPCYRKDDRAMRPIYGCPEKFRDSSQTPPATFPEICKRLLFRSILRMCTQNLKSAALSVPEIIGVLKKFGQSLDMPTLHFLSNF